MLFNFLPFDLPAFTPKMPTGKEAKYLNSLQGMEMFKRICDIMLSRFKWNNLPESCNERALEITLCFYGYALFFDDSELGYMHTACTLSGPFNVYYESINRRAFSFEYTKEYSINNSVLIRGNKSMIPDYLVLMNYVPKLANCLRSIDVHTETLKRPFFIECEEKERKSIARALSDVQDNEIAILGRKAVDRSLAINLLNPNVTCHLTEMWTNFLSYYQQCLNALGVDNAFSSKKERMVQAEATGNDIAIRHTLESELWCRQQACEQINKMFGLKISVEANQIETFTNEQIMQDLGVIGGEDGESLQDV